MEEAASEAGVLALEAFLSGWCLRTFLRSVHRKKGDAEVKNEGKDGRTSDFDLVGGCLISEFGEA